MGGKNKIDTEYGPKTAVDIADLIECETGLIELLDALRDLIALYETSPGRDSNFARLFK